MDISDTRKANLWNLEALSRYLDTDPLRIVGFYEQLLADAEFIDQVNRQAETVRKDFGFTKGIFAMEEIPSVDWFAFERVLLYVLIRHIQPDHVLETGVFYGGNSLFLLKALEDNAQGKLVSIDYPDSTIRSDGENAQRHPGVGDSELYTAQLSPGFLIPPSLRARWELVEGDSLKQIPKRAETFELFVHDSDHAMPFLTKELAAVAPKLSENAMIVVDDIDWSNGFYAFCVDNKLHPILFTDNGKDNLRVRMGLAWRGHPNNASAAFTGSFDQRFSPLVKT